MNKKQTLKQMKYCLRFLPDEIYIQLYYYLQFKRFCNLKNPETFNEKLQWLKLHDHNPRYSQMVDKYEAKKYVASIIGDEYIIPTLGVWDSFDEINFNKLPNQFVLKCTHDSEGVIVVQDKSKLNLMEARKKINASLKCNFFYIGREWPYKELKPRILAEQYMEDTMDGELRDYKWLCFDGEPKVLYIAANRSTGHPTIDYYDASFEHLSLVKHYPNAKTPLHRPQTFEKMIEISRKLSAGIPHVRVDFYEVNGKLYFGELTFYTGSGFSPYKPEYWDRLFGSWLKLPE